MSSEQARTKTQAVAVISAVMMCVVAILASATQVILEDDGTIFSLAQSGDGNYYYLTLEGYDHFDEYMDQGSANNHELNEFLKERVTCGNGVNMFDSANCSVFLTKDSVDGGYLVGRNFDYYYPNTCAVFCSGDGILSSVSTVDLAMFCDTDEPYLRMCKDTRLNAAAYIPLDGVNEKGVFICINAVNNGDPVDQNESGKSRMFITSFLRVVLNYANTAYEATEMADRFNFYSNTDFHLFVCDNGGDGYSIEVIDGKTYVSETDLMTNHYISEEGRDTPVSESSRTRFDTLSATMEAHPTMDKTQVKEALASVKQENPDHIHYTRWSVVYDLEDRTVTIYLRIGDVMDYQHGHSYGLHNPIYG